LQNNLYNLAILLYIDTAGEKAIVALSEDTHLLAMETNEQSNTHASFVQVAIESIVAKAQINMQAIDAVVVTMGPGSYTGLRVGLATAKGIAYALNKPLIGLSTLALLAKHAIRHPFVEAHKNNLQIFSMIDAKRMEVFGAIYKTDETVILPEQAIILDSAYLQALLVNGPVLCVGNGATKTESLYQDHQLAFLPSSYSMEDLIGMGIKKWNEKAFEDLAYSKPSYLKDFYQPTAGNS
jgi:tRNA threonylcarbamoyladenosine biosynthesis protein TsaB